MMSLTWRNSLPDVRTKLRYKIVKVIRIWNVIKVVIRWETKQNIEIKITF